MVLRQQDLDLLLRHEHGRPHVRRRLFISVEFLARDGMDSPAEFANLALDALLVALDAGADLDSIHAQLQARLRQAHAVDDRPHSRACGISCPGHGRGCALDCPTCYGATNRSDGSALAQRAYPSSPTARSDHQPGARIAGPIGLHPNSHLDPAGDHWTPPE